MMKQTTERLTTSDVAERLETAIEIFLEGTERCDDNDEFLYQVLNDAKALIGRLEHRNPWVYSRSFRGDPSYTSPVSCPELSGGGVCLVRNLEDAHPTSKRVAQSFFNGLLHATTYIERQLLDNSEVARKAGNLPLAEGFMDIARDNHNIVTAVQEAYFLALRELGAFPEEG